MQNDYKCHHIIMNPVFFGRAVMSFMRDGFLLINKKNHFMFVLLNKISSKSQIIAIYPVKRVYTQHSTHTHTHTRKNHQQHINKSFLTYLRQQPVNSWTINFFKRMRRRVKQQKGNRRRRKKTFQLRRNHLQQFNQQIFKIANFHFIYGIYYYINAGCV